MKVFLVDFVNVLLHLVVIVICKAGPHSILGGHHHLASFKDSVFVETSL